MPNFLNAPIKLFTCTNLVSFIYDWSHGPIHHYHHRKPTKNQKKPDYKSCKPYKPKKRKYQPNKSYTRMTTSSTADTTNREHANLAKTAVSTIKEPTQKTHKLTIIEAEAKQGTQHQKDTETDAQPHTMTR